MASQKLKLKVAELKFKRGLSNEKIADELFKEELIPGALHYGTIAPYEIDTKSLYSTPDKAERHRCGLETAADEIAGLMANPSVQNVIEDINENVNCAIAGLGLVHPTDSDLATYGTNYPERLTVMRLLTPLGISPELLARDGAVGELSYSLFRENGSSEPAWHFFPVAGDGTQYAGVDFYRHLVVKRHPVIVAAAVQKWPALWSAINAKLFNVLITDAYTADLLLKARRHESQ